ncbi:MAG TPA: hypothetical protein VM884_07995 [Flavisolibacter sp.]|nr:hypothetical protein [Flavisolibacter sp.]
MAEILLSAFVASHSNENPGDFLKTNGMGLMEGHGWNGAPPDS